MEPNKTVKTGVELGIKIIGIVVAKNTYPNKHGEIKHQLDIACPGNRENITLGVSPEEFNAVTEMDKFESRITIQSINGRIIFTKI